MSFPHPTSQHFQIELHDTSEILVVQFTSPQLFEYLVINELDDALKSVIREHRPRHVVFDFSSVEFCSTSIINALIRVRRKQGRKDGCVAICEMRPAVHNAFKVLNLDNGVFEVCTTKDRALDYLRSLDDKDDDTADA